MVTELCSSYCQYQNIIDAHYFYGDSNITDNIVNLKLQVIFLSNVYI